MQPSPPYSAQPLPQLRPVRASDSTAMRQFVKALKPESRGLRFHGGVKADSSRLLAHLTQADGVRHIALVAVLACDDGELIVGEARCVRRASADAGYADFAIAVADAWQGRGLATQLLQALLKRAAEAGVERIEGDVLVHNARMATFMQRQGFEAGCSAEAGVTRWTRTLVAQRPVPSGFLAWLRTRLGAAASAASS